MMLLMYVHMCSLGSYCFYSVGVAFLHRGVISTLLIFLRFEDLDINFKAKDAYICIFTRFLLLTCFEPASPPFTPSLFQPYTDVQH